MKEPQVADVLINNLRSIAHNVAQVNSLVKRALHSGYTVTIIWHNPSTTTPRIEEKK